MDGGVGAELGTFRCRVRASGRTATFECLAPSSLAAAYAVGIRALQEDDAPWVQVVVSQWSRALGTYLVDPNAVVVSRGESAPPDADQVVFLDTPTEAIDES